MSGRASGENPNASMVFEFTCLYICALNGYKERIYTHLQAAGSGPCKCHNCKCKTPSYKHVYVHEDITYRSIHMSAGERSGLPHVFRC